MTATPDHSASPGIRIEADHIAFTDDGHAWWVVNASDRLDSRHTFNIEVEDDPHRVSIVHGMVLPVVGYRSDEVGLDRLKLAPEDVAYPATLFRAEPADDDLDLVYLPTAAASGMWAVKLKVES